jgi:hypothetical protein
MINITELETLARAATPGKWEATSIFNVWSQSHLICSTDDSDDSQYIAAANPATMLKLIEIIREQHQVIGAICKWDWEAMIRPSHADLDKALLDIVRADNSLRKTTELGVGDE